VLGLALDMSLRTRDDGKNLDDYMKYVWQQHGKPEIPYTVRDLQARLAEYAGETFANDFFGKYIFDSQSPDFAGLFEKMGVTFINVGAGKASLGGTLRKQRKGWQLTNNATVGAAIYKAGVEVEDVVLSLAGTELNDDSNINEILAAYKPGDTIEIKFKKMWGDEKSAQLTLEEAQQFATASNNNARQEAKARRTAWLLKK
jgi:predicted metalloprotease with PDZ domain